jgi:flagellar hook assembly protein FlgD
MAPNPFSHSLSLTVDVPEACGAVSVTLFDLAGRKVRVLASGALPAGRHNFQWDGRSQDGGRVAPGIYVVRLTGAGQTITRRATLLP